MVPSMLLEQLGVSRPKAISGLCDDDWNLVMGINVNGMMHSLRAEPRHMQSGASIVSLASNLGSKGAPGCAPHAASKHAVIGLTMRTAHDYGSKGTRINDVSPGGTHGPLMRSVVGDKPPPPPSIWRKYGQPEEVALQMAWLLGPESTHSLGSIFRVDGGEFC